MKRAYLISLFLIGCLVSCTGIQSSQSSPENQAFLEFIGDDDQYKDGLSVVIDDDISFAAEVHSSTSGTPKGKKYAISTGTKTVAVSYQGKVIYRQTVFLGNQETKRIILP